MNHDLIVVAIRKPHAKTILARHFAADPAISMQKAISMLENLPVVYKRELSSRELAAESAWLTKIGAVCRAVESKGLHEGTPVSQSQPAKAAALPVQDVSGVSETKKINSPVMSPLSSSSRPRIRIRGMEEAHTGNSRRAPVAPARVVLAVLVVAAAGLLILIGNRKKNSLEAPGKFLLHSGGKTGENLRKSDPAGARANIPLTKNQTVPARERKKNDRQLSTKINRLDSSDGYTDSALAVAGDHARAIAFFKIAISFNKYNLRAWQGLLAVYHDAAMGAEAEKTRQEMAELFFDTIASVEGIVEPFGEVTAFAQDGEGTCRLEYRPKTRSRQLLEQEMFYLIRALTASRECGAVSVFAATGKGTGALVRLPEGHVPHSFVRFKEHASFSFVE